MSYVPLLLHFCYKLVTTCLYGEPARVEQSEIISACWAIPPSHINTTKILREQGMSRAGLIKRVSLARQADSPHLINKPLEGTCKNSFTQYPRLSLRARPDWGTGISPSSYQHCLVSNQEGLGYESVYYGVINTRACKKCSGLSWFLLRTK